MKRLAIYHLETLLWIARLGTFGAAAERLNTSQPAISARVREIEEQLGVALFRREGRRMVLTPRGRDLVRDCEPLWAGFERALLKASAFAGASGVVRLGSGEIAAASCLPGFVRAVGRDLPGVTLEVEIDLTARLIQQLLAGTSDITFLAGPVASPGLRTTPIGSVDLVWAAREVGAGLEGRTVWGLPAHSPIHRIMHDDLDRHRQHLGHSPRAISTCNNVRTLIDVIAGGDGAALLPEPMIHADLRSGRLVALRPVLANAVEFEVAIRASEQDPLILELFARAGQLRITANTIL